MSPKGVFFISAKWGLEGVWVGGGLGWREFELEGVWVGGGLYTPLAQSIPDEVLKQTALECRKGHTM